LRNLGIEGFIKLQIADCGLRIEKKLRDLRIDVNSISGLAGWEV